MSTQLMQTHGQNDDEFIFNKCLNFGPIFSVIVIDVVVDVNVLFAVENC